YQHVGSPPDYIPATEKQISRVMSTDNDPSPREYSAERRSRGFLGLAATGVSCLAVCLIVIVYQGAGLPHADAALTSEVVASSTKPPQLEAGDKARAALLETNTVLQTAAVFKGPAVKPSFDCSRAAGTVQDLICSDVNLAQLNARLLWS